MSVLALLCGQCCGTSSDKGMKQALRRGERQENSWYHSSSRSSAIPRVSRIDGEAGGWREMLAVDVVSHFANHCMSLVNSKGLNVAKFSAIK